MLLRQLKYFFGYNRSTVTWEPDLINSRVNPSTLIYSRFSLLNKAASGCVDSILEFCRDTALK